MSIIYELQDITIRAPGLKDPSEKNNGTKIKHSKNLNLKVLKATLGLRRHEGLVVTCVAYCCHSEEATWIEMIPNLLALASLWNTDDPGAHGRRGQVQHKFKKLENLKLE